MSTLQRQAVVVYLNSKQLLLFGFSWLIMNEKIHFRSHHKKYIRGATWIYPRALSWRPQPHSKHEPLAQCWADVGLSS